MPNELVSIEKLRAVVLEILDDAFGVTDADLEAKLEEVGVDSLGLAEVVVEVEDRLNLPDDLDGKLNDVDRTGTLGALIDYLHQVINSLPVTAS